jgi:hypothetical protein
VQTYRKLHVKKKDAGHQTTPNIRHGKIEERSSERPQALQDLWATEAQWIV